MTNEPKYGPWIIWNGGKCPVGEGVKGQVQVGKETRENAAADVPCVLWTYTWEWESSGMGLDVIAYRLLIEPVVHREAMFWDQLRKEISGFKSRCASPREFTITVCRNEIKAEWVE